ncbi:ABC transporter substrate-binding protein [Glaciimonas sp. Gout2]|uniref:ABC transporter substrate-binding protein n=1 Tax=unclassified Glaciimonas TaxID=2644401 RepID=UPI002B23BE2D|nr:MULTISPECIES: ABC transporter substrate-binding protein [unclassified Glaciimonas]MEB0013847.1 ABC transporter substrate-binding protein [Glaciimonas sp. Cout2]MEB0083050.1 ABC transporter substrate-binding protein [Glaciimonas sp. Gout2]
MNHHHHHHNHAVKPSTFFFRYKTPTSGLSSCVRRVSVSLVIATVAITAHAFEQPNDGVYADRIDWGVIMDMSGTASGSQIPWVRGMQSYMRNLNEAGGINGRKVNLVLEDDRYEAPLVRIAYEKLSSQTPVIGISGLGNTSAQVALMPSIRRGKLPVVGTFAVTKAGIEPPSPMFYNGYCGFKQMAQVGVGYFADKLKLKALKVATVHMDVAGGKEYADYVDAEVHKYGGTSQAFPVKVGSADVTAQVMGIIAMKPDVVTVYGVPTPTILLMRTMLQYGLKIPTFSITQLGTPDIYSALGPEAGRDYHFVSCFTPGDIEEPGGIKEMAAAADKYGFGGLKTNVNFVGGWVVGELVADAITRAGKEPTRAAMVEAMSKGFEVDTKGVSSPLKFTPDNHLGMSALRVYSYDYDAKRFKAYGKYSDYLKYVK